MRPVADLEGGTGAKKQNQKQFEFPDITDLNFRGFPVPVNKKSEFRNGPHQFQYLKLINQR